MAATIYEFLPAFMRTAAEDPEGAMQLLLDAAQMLYDGQSAELDGYPALLSPTEINRNFLVRGAPSFVDNAQVAVGKVLTSEGLTKVLLASPALPANDVLNDYAVYWQSGPLAGTYRRVLDTVYDPLATYPYQLILENAVPVQSTVLEQIYLCLPDRVYLPSTSDPRAGAYVGRWVRVASGASGTVQEVQYRRIEKYEVVPPPGGQPGDVGTKYIAYVESAFDYPPAPDAEIGVVTNYVPLQYLGNHVGIQVPVNIPESLQRLLIETATALYAIKGTRLSFDILLRLLGWRSEIVEIGSNYSQPLAAMPPFDLGTPVVAGVPVRHRPRPEPLLPYRAQGWGVVGTQYQTGVQRPEHREYDRVSSIQETAFGSAGVNSLGQTTVVAQLANPANDALGAGDAGMAFPDSDITLYVEPLLPQTTPINPSIFPGLVASVEPVRPVHVEVRGVGWLSKNVEPVYIAEQFQIAIYLTLAETLAVADSQFNWVLGTFGVYAEGSGVGEHMQIIRYALWDLSGDLWDGGGGVNNYPNSWDTSIMAGN